jgi:hypothetical protein
MNTLRTLTHGRPTSLIIPTYTMQNPAMSNFKWSASTPFTYQFTEVKYCSLINYKCGSEKMFETGAEMMTNGNTNLPSKMVRHVNGYYDHGSK